jgi:hypothetical protein
MASRTLSSDLSKGKPETDSISLPDVMRELNIYLGKGPEAQIKAEGVELFALISGCNGDEEIMMCAKLIGAVAATTGYSASVRQETKRMRDYANLNLLEQIDPLLFGSRTLPGGERINYSREFQGADRHPVPISIDEALKNPSPGIVIVNNLSYGGPQAYKAPSKAFPVIAFREVPFENYCIIGCIQKEIDATSLRWDEYSECARKMLFLPPPVIEEERLLKIKDSVYGNPIQFNGTRITHGRLANFPRGVREILPSSAFLYSPIGVDSSNLHQVIEWTIGYQLEEFKTKDANPYEIMASYAMYGIPIAFLRLIPISKKAWRASVMELNEFYDTAPYVICMWTPDATSFPASYHPVTTEEAIPMTSEDLRLEIEYGHSPEKARQVEKAFTIEVFSALSTHSIENTIISDGYCYAINICKRSSSQVKRLQAQTPFEEDLTDVDEDDGISFSAKEGKKSSVKKERKSLTKKARKSDCFLIPIRPTKTKIISPLSMQEVDIPTVQQVDDVLKSLKKALPYYFITARTLIFDEKDFLLAAVISPDNLVIYVKPSKTLPKELDVSEARRQMIQRKFLPIIWEREMAYSAIPESVDSPDTSATLLAGEMYLAMMIVHYHIIDLLIGIAKKYSLLVPTARASENPRGEYFKVLLTKCTKFVKFSSKSSVALYKYNVVLFSERITLSRYMYESIIIRLAARCPKKSQFIASYFSSFGSVLHNDQYSLEEWEKIAL